MADPLKSSVVEEGVDAATPVVPSEAQALQDRHAFEALRRKNQVTVVLPGGQRRVISPNVSARYSLNAQVRVLGEPESLLTEEYLAEHRGWKFEWPVGDTDETRSMLRNGQYHPVPPEALKKDNDFAIVGDSLTAMGTVISWRRHILVAVPKQVWQRRHIDPANYALERTAAGEDAAAALDSRFGSSGYRAEVEAFTERREESI